MKKGYLILLTAFILTILLASFATTFEPMTCDYDGFEINNTFSNQYFTIETDDCTYDSDGDTILVNVTQHIATFNSTFPLGVDLALWFPTFASMNHTPYYDGSALPSATFPWVNDTSKMFNITYGNVFINQASSFKFNISVNFTTLLKNYSILLDPIMNLSDEGGFEVLISEPANLSLVNVTTDFIFNITDGDSDSNYTCEFYVNGDINNTLFNVSSDEDITFNLSTLGFSVDSYAWFMNCSETDNSSIWNISETRLFNFTEPVSVICGQILTTSTTLTQDLTGCSGNGLVIESNNMVLDCDGNFISGDFTNTTSVGIYFGGQDNVTIKNCNVSNFAQGIRSWGSTGSSIINNVIFNNNVSDSDNRGIVFGTGMYDLTIANNNISNNDNNGIRFDSEESGLCNNITITGNRIEFHSEQGLYISENSTLTYVYNNYFANNVNVFDNGTTTIYNTTKVEGTNIIGGEFLGGNFWSDYAGDDDGDGIGVDNYTIGIYSSPGADYLPLYQEPGPIETSRCPNEINDGGEYYLLTQDLVTQSDWNDHYDYDCFQIKSGADNVVIDCQGHNIIGNTSVGAFLIESNNVTVKNCNLENVSRGFGIQNGQGHNITNNTIFDYTAMAIYLNNVNGSHFTLNDIDSDNTLIHGIELSYSNENLFEENFFYNLPDSGDSNPMILLGSNDKICSKNIINDNEFSNITIGVQITNGTYNNISFNNFTNGNNFTSTRSIMLKTSATANFIWGNLLRHNLSVQDNGSNNNWNLPAPIGGNNWTGLSEEGYVCVDIEAPFGFCDAPLFIDGSGSGVDNLPIYVDGSGNDSENDSMFEDLKISTYTNISDENILQINFTGISNTSENIGDLGFSVYRNDNNYSIYESFMRDFDPSGMEQNFTGFWSGSTLMFDGENVSYAIIASGDSGNIEWDMIEVEGLIDGDDFTVVYNLTFNNSNDSENAILLGGINDSDGCESDCNFSASEIENSMFTPVSEVYMGADEELTAVNLSLVNINDGAVSFVNYTVVIYLEDETEEFFYELLGTNFSVAMEMPDGFANVSVDKQSTKMVYNNTEVIEFIINVTNNGEVDLTNIMLFDEYNDSHITFENVSCEFFDNGTDFEGGYVDINVSECLGESLSPGDFTLIYINFTDAGIEGLPFNTTNFVEVNATSMMNGSVVLADDSHEINLTENVPEEDNISITKNLINGPVFEGGPAMFVINISNHGSKSYENLEVKDTWTDNINFTSDYSPNAEVVFDGINYTDKEAFWLVNLSPMGVATIYVNFTAIVIGATNNSVDIKKNDSVDYDQDTVSFNVLEMEEYSQNVSLTKTLLNDPFYEGDVVQFLINVTNLGSVLNGLELTDFYNSSELNFINQSLGSGDISFTGYNDGFGEAVWELNLSVDETILVYVNFSNLLTVGQNGSNFVEVYNFTDEIIAEDNETFEVLTRPDPVFTVNVTKNIVGEGPFNPGDTLTYEIFVENNGSTPLSRLVVEDFYNASMMEYQNVSCGYINDSISLTNASNVTVNLTECYNEFFQVGDNVTFYINFTALEVGGVDNYINVIMAPDRGVGQADEFTEVIPPGSANMTVVMTPSSPIVVGETITFTVNVTNNGTVDLTNLLLQDEYWKPDLQFESASCGFVDETICTSFYNDSNNIYCILINVSECAEGILAVNESTLINLNFTAVTESDYHSDFYTYLSGIEEYISTDRVSHDITSGDSVSLDLMIPSSNIGVYQGNSFDVSVNVTCENGPCDNLTVYLDPRTSTPQSYVVNDLRSQTITEPVDVIITLKDDSKIGISSNSVFTIQDLKEQTDSLQDSVLSSLTLSTSGLGIQSSADFDLKYKYEVVPALAGKISPEGLEKLKDNSNVESVQLEQTYHATLSYSVPLVGAPEVWQEQVGGNDLNGTGQTICIVDTGINSAHSDFSPGKVVAWKDYVNYETAPYDDQGHGSHCAGIASSEDSTYTGVAPGAKLAIIKVLNSSGSGDSSDVIAGINWCLYNRDVYDISVISLSLGCEGSGCTSHTSDCDSDSLSQAINLANSYGLTVAVASGNNGFGNGVASPSCASGAFTVGNSIKADDAIYSSSNTGELVDVFAPGTDIMATNYQGGHKPLTGTSMATPHVAGAAAILNQYYAEVYGTSFNSERIKEALNNTGKPITDVGVTRNRINISEALTYYAEEKGIIPMNSGDTFYTFDNNPRNISLTEGNSQVITWTVHTNRSADVAAYEFFAFENSSGTNINTNSVYVDVQEKLSPEINLTLNDSTNDVTIGIEESVMINGTSVGDGNLTLLVDGVPVQNSADINYLFNSSSERDFNITLFYDETNNYTSESETLFVTVEDVLAPVITLGVPENNFNSNDTSISFNASVHDQTSIANCSLLINGVIDSTDDGVGDSMDFNLNLVDGSYNWSVECYDNSDNFGISENRTLTIDTFSPVYSSVEETPSNGTTYVSGRAYEFNLTWVDTNLETVRLVFNGSEQTLSNSSNEYSATISDLNAGIYNYAWYANDSAGNQNNTGTLYYSVVKATPVCSLTFNPVSSITYNASVIANCSCTGDATEALYRTSQNVTSSENLVSTILSAETHDYNCTVDATTNYNSAENSSSYVVNQATTILSLTSTPDWSLEYGQTTNVSCSADNSEVIPSLYRNGTSVSNPDQQVLGAGTYTYVCNATASQNYSSASESDNLTITKADSSVNLLLNGVSNNRTVAISQNIALNGSVVSGEYVLELYEDGLEIANGISISEIVSYSTVGTYNITLVYPASENYSSSYETWFIIVEDVVAPVITLGVPHNNSYSNNVSVHFNASVYDQTGINNCSLLIDDVINSTEYAVVGNFMYFDLNFVDGSYNWKVECYDNSSNNNNVTSETRNFSVDLTAPETSVDAPSDWQTSSVLVNLTCNDVMSGCNYISYKLDEESWVNGTSVLISSTGNHTLYYYSVDNVSNVEPIKTVNVLIDLDNPTYSNYGDSSFENEIWANETLYIWANFSEQYPETTVLLVDGVIKNSTSYTNFVIFSWKHPGGSDIERNFTFAIKANDSSGRYNQTVNTSIFVKDNTGPVVDLISPDNHSINAGDEVLIYYNASDMSITNCSLYVDGLFNQTNTNVTPDAISNFTVDFPEGDNEWYVDCYDGSFNYGISETRRFIVDTTNPTYSNNVSSPINGIVYALGQDYQFNITWTDMYLDSVWLVFNGVQQNLTNLTNEYYKTLSNLAAGTYNYTWYANDSAGNYNTTGNLTYTILKATPVCSLSFDPLGMVYNSSVVANCTCTGAATEVLLRNGQDVTDSENLNSTILNAGNHTYNCTVAATTNYNAAINNSLYVVARADTGLNLTSTSNWGFEYGETTNVSCSANNSEVTPVLYRNGTKVLNPDQQILGAGTYTYVCNATASENYSERSETDNLTITKATDSLTLELNGNSTNMTVVYGTPIVVNATSNSGTETVYVNGSVAGGVLNLSAGYYNVSVSSLGNENYSENSGVSYFVNVTKANSSVNLLLNSVSNNITMNVSQNITLTGSVVSGESTLELYEDGLEIANGTSISEIISYSDEGTHNITLVYPASENYTSSYETWFITVEDVVAPEIVLVTPANNTFVGSASVNFVFNVTDDASGIENCSVYVNDVLANTNTSITSGQNFINANIGSGSKTWMIKCYDNSSNNNLGISSSRIVKVDTQAPVTSISGVVNGTTYYGNVTITLSASDLPALNSGVNMTVYNVSVPVEYSAPITYSTEGVYIIQYASMDNVLNEEITKSLTFTIDLTPPSLTIDAPSNSSNVSGTVLFNVTSDGACVNLYVNDTFKAQSNNYSWNTNLETDGVYELKAIAYDGSCGIGNNITKTINVTADNTKPSSTIISPSDNYLFNSVVSINGTATDATGLQTVEVYNGSSWNAATLVGSSWNFTFAPSTDGVYNIKSRATDILGNVELESSGISVIYDNSTSTISRIDATPNPAAPSTNVSITVETYDANGIDNVTVTINGTLVELSNIGGTDYQGTILAPSANGDYPIIINSYDLAGNHEIDFSERLVVNNSLPIISVSKVNESLFRNGTQITVTISNATYSYYNLSVNGSNIEFNNSVTFEVSGAEGRVYLEVYANNSSGVEVRNRYTFVIDNVDPEVFVDSLPTYTKFSTINVTGNVSEENNDYVLVNGNFATTISSDFWRQISLSEGNNSVTVVAVDRAENNASETVYTFLDTIVPESSVSLSGTLGDNGWYTSNVTATLSATDESPSSGTYTQYNTVGSWINGSSIVVLISGSGVYRSIDNAGNVEENNSLTIKIDKTIPAVSNVQVSESQPAVNSTVTITATIIDANWLSQKVLIDGTLYDMTLVSGNNYKYDLTVTEQKTYAVTIVAKDLAGLINDSESISFTSAIVDEDIVNTTGSDNTSGMYSDVNVGLGYEINGSTEFNVTVKKFNNAPFGYNLLTGGINYYDFNSTLDNVDWITIKLYYSDSEISGLDESSLKIHWYNESSSSWVELNAGSPEWVHSVGVNAAENYVWARVSHFSLYSFTGEAETTTTSSGGSGGSSSSSLNNDILATQSVELYELNYGSSFSIFEGDSFQRYRLYAESFGVRMSSSDFVYSLIPGKVNSIDLDFDGISDIDVTLISTSSSSAVLAVLEHFLRTNPALAFVKEFSDEDTDYPKIVLEDSNEEIIIESVPMADDKVVVSPPAVSDKDSNVGKIVFWSLLFVVIIIFGIIAMMRKKSKVVMWKF